MREQLYYVVSVKHTKREDPYITLWNPDDKGYCYRIEVAGKYSESHIAERLNYYHTGHSDMAVKCEVIDAMVIPSKQGYLDNPGLVAPNNKRMWQDILSNSKWETKNKPNPQYRGAPRCKE